MKKRRKSAPPPGSPPGSPFWDWTRCRRRPTGRQRFTPLLGYIGTLKATYPADRQIAVIIPELVESRRYQYPLHNQRATGFKAALLLKGDSRSVVINVPWYLKADRPEQVADEPTI